MNLEKEAVIDEIVVFNRTDCCVDRLSDFTVSVLDACDRVTFSQTFVSTPNPSMIINAAGAVGKSIRVETVSGYLSLAEVEVYGEEIDFAIPAEPEPVAGPDEIFAEADALVKAGVNREKNYGYLNRLTVNRNPDGAGIDKRSYLRFNLSELPDDFESVGLRLYVQNIGEEVSSVLYRIGMAQNNWNEIGGEGITWSTVPSNIGLSGTFPGNFLLENNFIVLTLTPFIEWAKGNSGDFGDQITFVISGEDAAIQFSSKEHSDSSREPVLLIDYGNSVQTNIVDVNIDESLSLQELNAEIFSVFPNPANDELNVQITAEGESVEVSLISLDGKIVFQETFETQSGINTIHMKVSDKAIGYHMLRVQNGENVRYEKVMIQH